jgi:hypothetical protein
MDLIAYVVLAIVVAHKLNSMTVFDFGRGLLRIEFAEPKEKETLTSPQKK